MAASRYFGVERAKKTHILRGNGLAREVDDSRRDIERAFKRVQDDVDAVTAITLKRGANLGNADATISVSGGAAYRIPAGTLTQNRQATINVTGATNREIVRVERLDISNFTYTIMNGGAGGGAMYVFPAGQKRVADFVFDGTNFSLAGQSAIE